MTKTGDRSNFLSLAQAAKKLNISRIAVYKRVKSGSLKAMRVGRSYIIPVKDLRVKNAKENEGPVDLRGLRFSASLCAVLRQAVWDYKISTRDLFKILTGKKTTFSLDQARLCARLLTGVDWYTLIDTFGVRRLYSMLGDETFRNIRNKDMRKRLIWARSVLRES